MNRIDGLHKIYFLKKIYRGNKVDNRNESTAEHTYSIIALAEYFLKLEKELNELEVIKLLLYHDFCEIYAGDTNIAIEQKTKLKEEIEDNAITRLELELPIEIGNEVKKYHKEFVEQKTREARFAKAIDKIDAVIQAIDTPEEWIKYNFTEKKLRELKEPYIKDFPEIKKFFEEMIKELNKKRIIPKE
ncbi:MAG: HD domain-containing protein [Candidatus ainarchaeum sp.]|nr:HD domain-containing protein [Candidatus ainarchaeum sp.]